MGATTASTLPPALASLTTHHRWVVWRWEVTSKGRKTKVPYQAADPSRKARSNGAETWGSYEAAIAIVEAGHADGIGFMLHDSEIAAFDIDDCRDPDSGEVAGWAWTLIDQCGSYAEVTVSGTGIRIIGYGRGAYVHRNQAWPGTGGRVETYRRATRYIVVTGQELGGTAGELIDIDPVIDEVVARLDTKSDEKPSAQSTFSEGAETDLPDELDRLIRYGAADGDRSDQFMHVVGWLKDRGWSVDDIERLLEQYPEGIAAKYQDRLRREIERCFGKAREKTSASGSAGDRAEQPRRPPEPIKLHWHGEDDGQPNRAWLVRNLVFETGCGLLSGQWGTYKTFIGLDISASVMTGLPFAGRRVVRRGGVLFIAPEGAFEIPIRLRGIVEERRFEIAQLGIGLNPEHLPIAWIDECPRLLDAASTPILAATAQAVADRLQREWDLPLVLIIIDTVAAGARFEDENSAAEAQKVISAMNDLGKATGAFVLGVDHFGKAVETGTRGSSGKDAGVDVMLAALGERDLAGAVSNTRLAVRKVRGARTGYEIPYLPKVVDIGQDDEGEAITTCVIEWKLDQETGYMPAKERDRWPTSLKVFRSALGVALAEGGKRIRPFGAEGPEVLAVPESRVRTEFVAAYPVDGDTQEKRADAKKKAYSRALRSARDRALVISRDIMGIDHLWLADEGDGQDK